MTWQMDRDNCAHRCDETRTGGSDFYDGFLMAMQIFLREGRGLFPRQAHISGRIGCFPSIQVDGDLSELTRLPTSLQTSGDMVTPNPDTRVRIQDARLDSVCRRLGSVLKNEGVEPFLRSVAGELRNRPPSDQQALALALNLSLPKPQFACDGTPGITFSARPEGGLDVKVVQGGWQTRTSQFRITQEGRVIARR